MIENRPLSTLVAHLALVLGIVIVAFPIYYTFVASTLPVQEILRPPLPLLPGDRFLENYGEALFGGVGQIGGVSVSTLLFNSTVVALAIAIGKIVISILSAYAIVFFRFPLRMVFFWLIFITLMLPVEVRILPTYKVMVDFGLIDTYVGLTLPLMASGRGASSAISCCRCRAPTSPRCSSSCSSMAGRNISGRCWSPTVTTWAPSSLH